MFIFVIWSTGMTETVFIDFTELSDGSLQSDCVLLKHGTLDCK